MQPMVVKIVLPILGGAPAVWNTALVFFQVTLLLGYAVAHLGATRLGPRVHVICYLSLVGLGLAVVPVAIDGGALGPFTAIEHPATWLLLRLAVTLGIPFLALAAGAPTLQVWLARAEHGASRNPYVLYAASNLGSLVALVSYPVLVEPTLSLRRQAELWALGYALLLLLLIIGALATGQLRPGCARTAAGCGEGEPGGDPIGMWRRLRWAALAFVPSSALLGVTAFLSADIGAGPLLWVVPLALYLATFVLAFASRPLRPLPNRVLPVLLLLVVLVDVSRMTLPVGVLVVVHLGTFFVVALACHARLADDRPAPARLTDYYLVIAAAGALGGAGTALVAPAVFDGVAEYPFILVVACLLVPWVSGGGASSARARALDLALPSVVGAVTVALVATAPRLGLEDERAQVAWMFGAPVVACYTLSDRPVRFALALIALLMAGQLYGGSAGRTLHRERSFFGVVRVTTDASGRFVQLVHGGTVHGRQRRGGPAEPLAYYHASGPAGDVFARFRDSRVPRSFAVVGLGVGALCAYAHDADEWVFYEIDALIDRLARAPTYFTFWTECRATKREVVHGDARLRLADAPDARYGLVVLDAFSADAVPLHLLTREALDLYIRKVSDAGWLVFHISSRTLDLRPALARLAEDAGWAAYVAEDLILTPAERAGGKDPSIWVVMARRSADMAGFAGSRRWQRLAAAPETPLWTDDFSNVWSAVRWW